MNALVQYHRRSLTILFFLCFSLAAAAQPKAGFSATPLAGCSPLVVYFFDSSQGSPTQWRWDLGNGVTSQLRNPSATYFNPGTYTVRLIVSNSKGADTVIKKEYITVYAAPVPDFGFDKSAAVFRCPSLSPIKAPRAAAPSFRGSGILVMVPSLPRKIPNTCTPRPAILP
jgi:PKD repeat protein